MRLLLVLVRFALSLAAIVAASTPTLHAQPAGIVGRAIVCVDLPEDGTAPDDLAAALAAAERYELSVDALSRTLGRAARERDPRHIPILKEIVEAYRCGVGNASLAMQAIAAAGEPADYFLAYVADAARDDALAYYAAESIGSMLDPALLPALDSVIAALPEIGKDDEQGSRRLGPRGKDIVVAGWNAHAMLGLDEQHRRTLPTERRIDFLLGAPISVPLSGVFIDGELVTAETDPWRGGRVARAAYRQGLWEAARTHPTAVQDLAAGATARIARHAADRGWTPAQVAQAAAVAEQIALETAFPSTAPPTPPVRSGVPLTLSACRGELPGYPPRDDGATESAAFVYSADNVAPFRIPYGPENRVVTSDGNEVQYAAPEVFYADDSARPEMRLFRVVLPPGGSVAWYVGQTSITVDASTPPCAADGTPPVSSVPKCDGLDATVYVAAGTIVGGPDAGAPYAGTLRGSNQSDVLVGTDGPDTVEAGNGSDVVCGLGGDDTLFGDNGTDTLFGGPGNDALSGGNGRDTLVGGPGTDSADGGRGKDACDAETETACESDPD